jgi:hypothetical protein
MKTQQQFDELELSAKEAIERDFTEFQITSETRDIFYTLLNQWRANGRTLSKYLQPYEKTEIAVNEVLKPVATRNLKRCELHRISGNRSP